jgi:hypothetical protein
MNDGRPKIPGEVKAGVKERTKDDDMVICLLTEIFFVTGGAAVLVIAHSKKLSGDRTRAPDTK